MARKPSKNEHIDKYKHNKDFAKNGINNTDKYVDWFVVAIFYAVLHIVEARLCETDCSDYFYEEEHNHKSRWEYIKYKDIFKEVRADYKNLYSLSIKARYTCITVDDQDAYNAEMCLDSVESHFRKSIN